MAIKKTKKKRKIAMIIGGRMTYGHFRPIMREIKKNPNLDYHVIATNMQLLPEFGYSVQHLEEDGSPIFAKVHNTLAGYNPITMVKSLGVFLLQLPEIIEQMKADIILIAGDRGEHLIGATVGAHMNIPVAHIQAGEVSGNIDGMTRHAITKYAHIHFAPNQDSAERLLKMGEQDFRVFNVGAPQLDDLFGGHVTPDHEVYKKFNLDKNKPILLFVQHSVTEEVLDTERQIIESLEALNKLGYQTVAVLNNSDAGSNIIRRAIMEHKKQFLQLHPNLARKDYAGLMKVASVMVGNSSSGIIEAPAMKLATVNIGNRQRNRVQSSNVINVGHNRIEIIRAVRKAITPAFQKRVEACTSPYGDGKSAKKIVAILEKIPIGEELLVKKITY